MRFRNKLFVLLLFLSTFPLIVIGMFSYYLSADIIKEKEIDRNIIVLSQMDRLVSSFVDDKDVVTLSFLVDKNIQSLIKNPELAGAARQKIDFAIKRKIFDYHNLFGADSIVLILNSRLFYSNRTDLDEYYKQLQEKSWFKVAVEKKTRWFWGQPHLLGDEIVIPFVRVLTNFSSLVPQGLVIINLKETFFQSLYSNYMSYNDVLLFVTTSKSVLIMHPDKDAIGKDITDLYGIDQSLIRAESGSFLRRGGGHNDLVLYLRDPVLGLDFYSVTSLAVLFKSVVFIRRATVFALLVMLVLGFLFSFLFSQSFLSPITKLINVITHIETNNLHNITIPMFNNEIGPIALSFATMVTKLKASIDNEIRMQREKRDADLRVLEFQINPHFLYNTLSSVIWLSRENRNDDVIRVAKSLSNLFRISISKGKEIITIEEEIEHVKSYLEIEKIRHGDAFNIEYEVDPAIMKNLTEKLILQPIVENAIYHGIKQSTTNRGTIQIRVQNLGSYIRFQVIDNGDTITESEIARINELLEGNISFEPKFGIGIRNVNDRIRLTYGKPYGLTFEKSGPLTIVNILIPRIGGRT
jgi:two-component system sensor histidine kinase YesM